MTIIYFTTTGNSLAVARALQPGARLLSVVALLTQGVTEVTDTEAVGLVCPVYFGGLPAPVRELISKVPLRAPYRFAVLTCGSTPAMAMRELPEFDYVRGILMVDNYFPMFDVARQVADLPKKRVGEHLAQICADVASRRRFVERPSLYGRIAGWYMRLFPLSRSAYKRFRVDPAKCTLCGVCQRVCPISNIAMADLPQIGPRCLTCGACRHNCPEGAITYRGEKSAYRYRNPSVTLADILRTMAKK